MKKPICGDKAINEIMERIISQRKFHELIGAAKMLLTKRGSMSLEDLAFDLAVTLKHHSNLFFSVRKKKRVEEFLAYFEDLELRGKTEPWIEIIILALREFAPKK
jgi:hypothetical protein